MKPCFKINADYDIKLLPYSPVYENDPLEIRCQVFNSGDDGDVTLTFCLDGTNVYSETVFVKKNCYGFAKYVADMNGKAGKHTVCVNGASVPFEVIAERKTALDGGFIMLGPPNDRIFCRTFSEDIKRMTDDDWKRYIDELASIGQRTVIIMAAYQFLNIKDEDIHAHFNSKLYPKSDIAADNPIAAILSQAQKHEMNVFIGIGNPYGWMGTVDCFKEIYEQFGSYTAFYGWYMGYEFDMQNLRADKIKMSEQLIATARKLCPVKPILTSPFGSPSREFVEYITNNDVFDIMMPQDCVGQCRLTLNGSREAYRILLNACKTAKKHLWANCEAFNFGPAEIDGKIQQALVPRYKGGGMNGEEGFIKQMEVVRPFSEKILTFMFSGFFCPPDFKPVMGGKAAVKQFEDYVKYCNGL